MTKPKTVDDYLAQLPDDARPTLEKVRAMIRSLAPTADESISYGMPGYKHNGRPLIYFGASKSHWGLYGAVHADHPELVADYDTSKGTIRFPYGKLPPKSLLKTLLKARIADIEQSAAAKTKAKKRPGK